MELGDKHSVQAMEGKYSQPLASLGQGKCSMPGCGLYIPIVPMNVWTHF